jgi:hypothetical protein
LYTAALYGAENFWKGESMADRQFRKNYRNSSSKVIALSGIFLALAVLSLYAQSLAPAGKLSLYALSSLFVSVIVIEAGIYAGWLFYLASSLLAFILVPEQVKPYSILCILRFIRAD